MKQTGQVVVSHPQSQPGIFNFKYLMAKNAVHLGIKLQAKGLFLDIAVSSETPRYLQGDPVLLEKILRTLVHHSMQCLHCGGITISIHSVDLTFQGQHRLLIAINESSHGMMPEELDSLNESLQENKEAKESIAPLLREAAQWIKSLNGHLSVESVFGWGTRYLVTLNLGMAGGEHSCLGAA